jgi:molecular chaperone DnaK
VGIDFGTTNSLCAVHTPDGPVIVPNAFGNPTTPSAVGIALDGTPLVGEPALRLAPRHPERAVLAVKRLLGRDVFVGVDGQHYEPPLLASFVLRSLVRDAEAYLGTGVTSAVLTAPAYFDEAQLDGLRRAAVLADVDPVRIIPESTAACLHAGVFRDLDDGRDGLAAVFDLGGGTFDISLVRGGEGVFEVIAVNGDTGLGGLDFDEVLVDYCIDQFRRATGVDLADDDVARMRVREAAEGARIVLSTAQHATIDVPFICADRGTVHHLEVPLSRDRFDELTDHLVARAIECCRRATADAGVPGPSVRRLLLVGLATRTPNVAAAASRFFGQDPVRGVAPDRAVALGAGVQAGVLQGKNRQALLLDATSLTLSVEADGVACPVIPRNTTIPAARTREFTTTEDGQVAAVVHVLQGEATDPSSNVSLGRFVFPLLSRAPRGAPEISITFDLDAAGRLLVTAREKASDRVRTVAVTQSEPVFETPPEGTSGAIAERRHDPAPASGP